MISFVTGCEDTQRLPVSLTPATDSHVNLLPFDELVLRSSQPLNFVFTDVCLVPVRIGCRTSISVQMIYMYALHLLISEHGESKSIGKPGIV